MTIQDQPGSVRSARKKARSGVVRSSRAAWSLPGELSRLHVKRHHLTGQVLIVHKDQSVLIHDRRMSQAMFGLKGPRFEFPRQITLLRQSGQNQLSPLHAGDEHMTSISRWARTGEVVIRMEIVVRDGKILLPKGGTVAGVQAVHGKMTGAGIGAGDEELFTPEDWRGVANPREFRLPNIVVGAPLGR